jgi:outer membrane biosynthesis protein TonB
VRKLVVQMSGVVAVAMAAAAVAACGKVQAKTPAPMPSLTVPDPPSRMVMPSTVDLSAPPPPAEKPAPTPAAKPATPKPATTPAVTPTPTPSPTPPPTVADPPVLQTPQSQAQLERKARDTIESASTALRRFKRESLGNDARDQYDSANRYIQLANDAIAAKNFIYAVSCAEKAATLASLIK